MKKKKLLIMIILITLIIIIGVLVYLKVKESKEIAVETQITPLEEITEEQERETMISLYYTNTENNTLIPEARKIDAKELVENPYKKLVELIIEKPKNEKLVSSIPEGTKVNKAELKNGIVELDLSKEFIENQTKDIEKAKLSIKAIVNTLTELNEVKAVKILIDGKENQKFKNIDLSLDKEFTREN